MLRWIFKTYSSKNGRNDVQETIDAYDDYAREAFSRAISHLSVTEKLQWQEPNAKKLRNEDPLYEIRYKANRCATRALGFFGPEENTFTIVLICTHKGRVYKPPKAFESAQGRVREAVANPSQTVSLKIDGEDFPPDGG